MSEIELIEEEFILNRSFTFPHTPLCEVKVLETVRKLCPPEIDFSTRFDKKKKRKKLVYRHVNNLSNT